MLDNWIVFGDEQGTCVDFSFSDADEVEIRVRLSAFATASGLDAVCGFTAALRSKRFDPTTGSMLEPDRSSVAFALSGSCVAAFVRSPRSFYQHYDFNRLVKKIKAWPFIATFTTLVIAFTFAREAGSGCRDSENIVTTQGAVELALFSEARYEYGAISPDEAGIREFVRANPDCCNVTVSRGSVIDKIFKRASEFDVTLKYPANLKMEKLSHGKFYEAVYRIDSCGKIRDRKGGFFTS